MKVSSIRLEPTENGCFIYVSGSMEPSEAKMDNMRPVVDGQWVDAKFNGSVELWESVLGHIKEVQYEAEPPKVKMIDPSTFR